MTLQKCGGFSSAQRASSKLGMRRPIPSNSLLGLSAALPQPEAPWSMPWPLVSWPLDTAAGPQVSIIGLQDTVGSGFSYPVRSRRLDRMKLPFSQLNRGHQSMVSSGSPGSPTCAPWAPVERHAEQGWEPWYSRDTGAGAQGERSSPCVLTVASLVTSLLGNPGNRSRLRSTLPTRRPHKILLMISKVLKALS